MPSEHVESFLTRMNEAGMKALETAVNGEPPKPDAQPKVTPQKDPETGKFVAKTEGAEPEVKDEPNAELEVEVLGGKWKESEIARWRDVAEREKAGLSEFQQFQLRVRQEAEAVEAEKARLSKIEFEAAKRMEEAEAVLAMAMEDEEGFLRHAERLKAQGYKPEVKKAEPAAPITAESIAAEMAKLNEKQAAERARAESEASSNKTYVDTLTAAINEKAGNSQTTKRLLWAAVNTLERQKHLRPGMEPSFIKYAVDSINTQLQKELAADGISPKPTSKTTQAPPAKAVPPSTGGGTALPSPPKMDKKILSGDPGSYASALMNHYKSLGMLEPST